MKNYILRINFNDVSDKFPFSAIDDRNAVVSGLEAVENFLNHGFIIEQFVIDTLEIGPVHEGMIQTSSVSRLFESDGDSDLNLLDDDELIESHLEIVKEIRLLGERD